LDPALELKVGVDRDAGVKAVIINTLRVKVKPNSSDAENTGVGHGTESLGVDHDVLH
jgi:hypothetical protein